MPTKRQRPRRLPTRVLRARRLLRRLRSPGDPGARPPASGRHRPGPNAAAALLAVLQSQDRLHGRWRVSVRRGRRSLAGSHARLRGSSTLGLEACATHRGLRGSAGSVSAIGCGYPPPSGGTVTLLSAAIKTHEESAWVQRDRSNRSSTRGCWKPPNTVVLLPSMRNGVGSQRAGRRALPTGPCWGRKRNPSRADGAEISPSR